MARSYDAIDVAVLPRPFAAKVFVVRLKPACNEPLHEAGQTFITNLSEEILVTLFVGTHYDSSVIIILGKKIPILKAPRLIH